MVDYKILGKTIQKKANLDFQGMFTQPQDHEINL